MKSLKKLKEKKEDVVRDVKVEIRKELTEGIDEHLAKRNAPAFKQVSGFHPSYTNQCGRYWYYLFNGVEITQSFSPQTYRIFDNGHSVHNRLYSYFRDMGILLEEEIPVSWGNSAN